MIKTIIKITLVTLWVLLLTGCILVAVFDAQLRKTALITLSIVLTVPASFLLIRRAIIRKKEKSFVNRVITADQQAIRRTEISNNEELLALQQSWKESLNRLRTSRLKSSGNPLYALPWYLVIGESRTGKTSMIAHSGLTSPLAKTVTTTTLSVTRNCDWWFFNEAIILDTAGRYTVPIDPQRDTPEWEAFLKLLARFRRKEPINGIVAAISAEKLLKLSSEELVEHGALIRARIDQVMRSLGKSFPVYIMVTKMDLVFGMPEFFRTLPRSRLGQAMGWCNSSHAPCSDALIDTAMQSICESLRVLRSRMLHGTNTPEAEVLIFPNKFQELSPGLHTFSTAVFTDNVYQVTPQFRGIYFSSALQNVKLGGVEQDEQALSDSMLSGGMFLREFFSSILPGDRKLFYSIPEYAVRRIIDSTFFRIGWVTVWMVMLLLIWSGYHRNYTLLQTLKTLSPVSTGTVPVTSLEPIRAAIHKLHDNNSRLLPLRMGMRQSITSEKQLRQYYLYTFEHAVHSPVTQRITTAIQQTSPSFSEDSVIRAVTFFTALAGLTLNPTYDSLYLKEYYNAADNYLPILLPDHSDSQIRKLLYQYGDWIIWSDQKTIEHFRQFIYDQLIVLLEKKGANLHWCTRYPLHGINPVTMGNFWGSAAIPLVINQSVASIQTDSLIVRCSPVSDAATICTIDALQTYPIDSVQSNWIRIRLPEGTNGWIASRYTSISKQSDTIQVPGAFTLRGFKRIQNFLNHIDSRISDQTLKISFDSQKSNFYQWYWENFYQQWYTVMDRFIDGCNTSVSEAMLRSFMLSVPEGTDPCSNFIQTLASELDSVDTSQQNPNWREQVLLLTDVERAAQQKARDSSATGLTRTKNSVFGVFKKIGKEASEYVDQNALIRSQKIESSIASWNSYRNAVATLYNQALQLGGTLQFAHILFNPEDTGSETYMTAFDAGRDLKKKLFNDKIDDALWRVVNGPLIILKKIAYIEAEAELQRLWQMRVLSKLRHTATEEQVEFLFAPDTGLVSIFLADPFVSAFLQATPAGDMVPVEGPDGPLQFTETFMGFLNRGLRYSVKSEYPLTVQTVPFSVNADAAEEPYETMLRLQCAEGATVLENFNHYETIDFNYHPASCGEVTLKVVFPSFTAVKTWSGRWGFPQFLMTFRDGVNVITSDDFDLQYQAQIKRKNIKWVRVSYVIDPATAAEITDIVRNIPRDIPQKIMAGL